MGISCAYRLEPDMDQTDIIHVSHMYQHSPGGGVVGGWVCGVPGGSGVSVTHMVCVSCVYQIISALYVADVSDMYQAHISIPLEAVGLGVCPEGAAYQCAISCAYHAHISIVRHLRIRRVSDAYQPDLDVPYHAHIGFICEGSRIGCVSDTYCAAVGGGLSQCAYRTRISLVSVGVEASICISLYQTCIVSVSGLRITLS